LDNTIIQNSYYDATTAQRTDVIATAKTTAEMQNAGTFVGWDFADTWLVAADRNEGYPTFPFQLALLITYERIAHYVKQSGLWVEVTDEETLTTANFSNFNSAASVLIASAVKAALGIGS